jgi:hypothetical protein
MFQLNGNPISIDSEQVINGIRYPHLRDPALREQLGVTEVADPEWYDQRFYWGVGNPKQLDDIQVTPNEGDPYTQKGMKSQWIAEVKDTAGKMLANTDWMVIRKAERNVDIPATVVAKRAAIVAECDRLETAITACATVEELITVVGAQDWPNDHL